MTNELIQIAQESTRGSFFLAIGSLVSTVISAIGVFLIAGLLGPELHGVYILSFAVPSIFLLLVNLGVNQGLTRAHSERAIEKTKPLAFIMEHFFSFERILLVFLRRNVLLMKNPTSERRRTKHQ